MSNDEQLVKNIFLYIVVGCANINFIRFFFFCLMSPKLILKCAKSFFALPQHKKNLFLEIGASSVGLHGTEFTFVEDGLATIHNSDFCKDSRFEKAYELGRLTNSWKGWDLRWRAYLICCFADYAKSLPGDFVECGVNLGANARMLIEFLPFLSLNKNFFLFDTFSGFDRDLLSAEERADISKLYSYSSCLPEVQKTFAEFPFVKLVQGSVPASLKSVVFTKICFLSIDMNCVAPEIAAFEYLWPFVTPGGVVLLDDYGFKAHIRQKWAFDQLGSKLGFRVIQLPTGQGLVMKMVS